MAHFWAGALSYEKEDHIAFVRQLLDAGTITSEDTVEVDGGPQFADVSACRDPESNGPRPFFQKVSEGKAVKNPVHPHPPVGKDRYPAQAAPFGAAGAT